MCAEVIVFGVLALYLGILLYFQIQREKIIMKQINPTHANSRSTHERDLISRADAIEAVVNAHPMAEAEKGSSKQVFWVRVSDVAKALKALPSADAVHGEWHRRIVDNGYNADWVCSECGYRASYNHYNYCPSCGARMKGGAE